MPPAQRYYAAPFPAPLSEPFPVYAATLTRATWLGRWGLGCSIGSFLLPVLAWVVVGIRGGPSPGAVVLMVLAPLSAVLGVVFSSVGMRRCYTRRGLAIAGLAVGLVALVPVVLGVVLGVVVFAAGSHG